MKSPCCNADVINNVCSDCGSAVGATTAPAAAASSVAGTTPAASKAGVSTTASVTSSRSAIRAALSARTSRVSEKVTFLSEVVRSTSPSSSSVNRRKRIIESNSSERLGGGLIEVPAVPAVDLAKKIRTDIKIKKHLRVCSNPKCATHDPNYRDEAGRPFELTLDQGFCPECGAFYNFSTLAPKTIVGSQYEIVGAFASGGCGIIYAAKDKYLNDRPCVLKGMIKSADPEAMQAAAIERTFLVKLGGPHVVQIYNFVPYERQLNLGKRVVNHKQFFIVTEYCDGKPLDKIREERGPLPVSEAIAYILGICPAFSSVHEKGCGYCDGKPGNFIVTPNSSMILIDLGGVLLLTDTQSNICVTPGFCSPEGEQSVSVEADVYTLGRSLLQLITDWDIADPDHLHRLPTLDEDKVLASPENEALRRILARATATNPADRFHSVVEFADQLQRVQREVISIDTGKALPSESAIFNEGVYDPAAGLTYKLLPELRLDRDDPASSIVETALRKEGTKAQLDELLAAKAQFIKDAGLTAIGKLSGNKFELSKLITDRKGDLSFDQKKVEAALKSGKYTGKGGIEQKFTDEERSILTKLIETATLGTPELSLRIAKCLIDLRKYDEAAGILESVIQSDVDDPRGVYVRGSLRVAQGKLNDAASDIDAVCTQLPGEQGPKLALAIINEFQKNYDNAIRLYLLALAVNPNCTSASFGLGRSYRATGDRAAAVDAYSKVETNSSLFVVSQMEQVRALIESNPKPPSADFFKQAASVLAAIQAPGKELCLLTRDVALTAARLLEEGKIKADSTIKFGDFALDSRSMRFMAEKALRECGTKYAATAEEGGRLIIEANSVRPFTIS